MTIDTLGALTSKGIPLGIVVDHIFQAETAKNEGDRDKFDEHIRLAFNEIVDDLGVEGEIEWNRWLLATLSLFEDVPRSIMDVLTEAEDLYERGEHANASSLNNRLKRTIDDRMGDHWSKLRNYT